MGLLFMVVNMVKWIQNLFGVQDGGGRIYLSVMYCATFLIKCVYDYNTIQGVWLAGDGVVAGS